MNYLGIDIGGSNIAAAIVHSDYSVSGRAKIKVRKGIDAAEFCDDIASVALTAAKEAGISMTDVAYCGIGCPGIISSHSGVLEYAGNLEFSDLPLGYEISRRLGVSTYIENDANCAALGEVCAGAAKGAESALMVTVGTGIGGGIVIDGKVYSGVNGIAGEIGHMTLFPGGTQCSCGRKGCWEAYASATALKRQTREAMQADPGSLMWKYAPSLDRVSGKTAFQAKRDGDAAGARVVETYIYYLAEGLANCINILQPEVVCIGGGVCNEGDGLMIPLREQVFRYRFGRGNIRHPRIEVAQLWGEAGIIGAAMLGRGRH